MGKLFYMMGKSSSGKDTVYRRLLTEGEPALRTLVPYTTRPMRAGEENGREYFFTDKEGLDELRAQGKVIEERLYMTWHGPWYYFTVDDGQIDLEAADYLVIGTLESFLAVKKYYGEERVLPIYIEVDDGERLARALARERAQENPKYEELCRRFLADAEDFSEEKLEAAGIMRRFPNDELERCIAQVREYMEQMRQ